MEEQKVKIEIEKEETKPKFDKWEIENAVRTLIEAEKIKNNQELMAFVAPELDKQCKATKSAAEILYGVGNKEEGVQCQK